MSAILRYTTDERGHHSAVLACGHTQEIHNRGPYRDAWVLTEEGRQRYIGRDRRCRECEGRRHGEH